MGEITKQDVVTFRDALIRHVSAKTVNHNLKALKMLFKSTRRDFKALYITKNQPTLLALNTFTVIRGLKNSMSAGKERPIPISDR